MNSWALLQKKWKITKLKIRRGRVDIHRDQAIVERFNRTLAERLFGHQYAVEMRMSEGQRSTAWVKGLPEVVAALNNEVTKLIDKKPTVAIKEKNVYAKPSTPYLRPVGEREKKLPFLVNVRYLYQPGELEGGVKRATDPIWSLKVFNIERSFTKPNQPVLYYLHDGPKRGFVRLCFLCFVHNYVPSNYNISFKASSISSISVFVKASRSISFISVVANKASISSIALLYP